MAKRSEKGGEGVPKILTGGAPNLRGGVPKILTGGAPNLKGGVPKILTEYSLMDKRSEKGGGPQNPEGTPNLKGGGVPKILTGGTPNLKGGSPKS